jgi:hypothetical protein
MAVQVVVDPSEPKPVRSLDDHMRTRPSAKCAAAAAMIGVLTGASHDEWVGDVPEGGGGDGAVGLGTGGLPPETIVNFLEYGVPFEPVAAVPE